MKKPRKKPDAMARLREVVRAETTWNGCAPDSRRQRILRAVNALLRERADAAQHAYETGHDQWGIRNAVIGKGRK